jgi:hypothetical protein
VFREGSCGENVASTCADALGARLDSSEKPQGMKSKPRDVGFVAQF